MGVVYAMVFTSFAFVEVTVVVWIPGRGATTASESIKRIGAMAFLRFR